MAGGSIEGEKLFNSLLEPQGFSGVSKLCGLGMMALLLVLPLAGAGELMASREPRLMVLLLVLQELKQAEQESLLDLADQASRAHEFSKAREYIQQAKNRAYNPTAVAGAQQVYDAEYARWQQQQVVLKQQEAARSAAAARASTSSGSASGSSSGSAPSYIAVQHDFVCGLGYCAPSNTLRLWGGPGRVENASRGVLVLDQGRGITGAYQWQGSTSDGKHQCSGTINIGSRNVMIKVYDSCRDAGTYEF